MRATATASSAAPTNQVAAEAHQSGVDKNCRRQRSCLYAPTPAADSGGRSAMRPPTRSAGLCSVPRCPVVNVTTAAWVVATRMGLLSWLLLVSMLKGGPAKARRPCTVNHCARHGPCSGLAASQAAVQCGELRCGL